MTYIIGTFKFHCKTGHKQIKSQNRANKTKLCKSESIFTYLQSSTLIN